MNKENIKNKIAQEIDKSFNYLKDLAQVLNNSPELGYKEEKTSAIIKEEFAKLGIDTNNRVAYTGFKGSLKGRSGGVKIAVLGELDSVICHQHPMADKITGAAHACGHFAQLVLLVGLAMAFKNSAVMDFLSGEVCLMALPAEEFIDLEYRERLISEGYIKYKSGKQQAIWEGHFDDVGIALMHHLLPRTFPYTIYAGMTSNTFISKMVTYTGKEAHAGAAPHEGINALNMAMLALNNINAQRETFIEDDKVRVHSIIHKGGDAVNVIPSEVIMETVVRGSSLDAVQRAVQKVDQCLVAGSLAIGGNISIKNTAGYLPLVNDERLMDIYIGNMEQFVEKERIAKMGSIAASFDFGDVTHLIPGLHSFICAAEGNLHTKEFKVFNEQLAYTQSLKAMAFTIVDLLFDEGKLAKQIINEYKPKMTKESYLKYLQDNSKNNGRKTYEI